MTTETIASQMHMTVISGISLVYASRESRWKEGWYLRWHCDRCEYELEWPLSIGGEAPFNEMRDAYQHHFFEKHARIVEVT